MTAAALARRRVPPVDPAAACVAGRVDGAAFALAGAPGDPEAWHVGPLAALAPTPLAVATDGGLDAALARVTRAVADRRLAGGSSRTGVALALAYDAGGAPPGPRLLALEVDAVVCGAGSDGGAEVLVRRGDGDVAAAERRADDWARRLDDPRPAPPTPRPAGPPATSLPRREYEAAVRAVQRHIALGDIYQANLCQRVDVPVTGDSLGLFAALLATSPAPRAAHLECGGTAVVSASPEVFLDWDASGRIATVPIKGTRPRHVEPARDREAARELAASAKDRAELLMIVDLERNDLGRVCRTGSVRVVELHGLRSWASVHHLVARVEGRLRADADLAAIVAAAFPGGSISGAPKRRAVEILRRLEPAPRGFFTGSLFWLGDDGSAQSSILIRTATVAGGIVSFGAGGGIVADSDPEHEWRESSHKARTIARPLGIEPEEL